MNYEYKILRNITRATALQLTVNNSKRTETPNNKKERKYDMIKYANDAICADFEKKRQIKIPRSKAHAVTF